MYLILCILQNIFYEIIRVDIALKQYDFHQL